MFTFNSSDWLSWWLAALAILLLIASYLDKSAALRGTYGQPPPWLADKILRLFFFCVLVAPTLSLSGFLVIPYLAYLPTYLDGRVMFNRNLLVNTFEHDSVRV